MNLFMVYHAPLKRCGLVLFLLGVMASSLWAHPTDFLPRGDWAYDAMAALAAKRLLPDTPARLFHGDRLLSRLEMARILTRALEAAAQNRDNALAYDPLFERLAFLLAPELEILQAPLPEPTLPIPPEKERLSVSGYVRGRWVSGEDTPDTFEGIFRLTALVDLGPRWFIGGTLTDERRRALSGQDIFFPVQVVPDPASALPNAPEKVVAFPGRDFLKDRFPVLDKLFIQGSIGNLGLRVGRYPIRRGPSYTGGMLFSENAPNPTTLSMTLPLSLGFLGRWSLDQFYTTWKEEGSRRYLVGRRIEHKFGGNWYFGISEALKSAGDSIRAEAAIIPLYYYHKGKDIDFNYLTGFDLAYRATDGKEYYAELLIDDLKNPFGKRSTTPRKIGALLGAYLPRIGSERTSFRAEFIFTDQQTFLHKNPKAAYTFDQLFLGHPIGPNARAVFLRLDHRFSGKLVAAVEGLFQRAKESHPEVGDRNIGLLSISYDLTPTQTLGLKWLPSKTSEGRGNEVSASRLQLEGTFHF